MKKDIHFQIPGTLFDEFLKMYPGHGERKAILIKFIKTAIKLKAHQDYFLGLITKDIQSDQTRRAYAKLDRDNR